MGRPPRRGRGRGKKGKKPPLSREEIERRLRLPRKGEIFGIVVALLGGSRMKVACKDGKERIARIPGKLRKGMWIKEGDVVIVKPWEIEGNKKGDVVYRYYPIQSKILKEKGYI